MAQPSTALTRSASQWLDLGLDKDHERERDGTGQLSSFECANGEVVVRSPCLSTKALKLLLAVETEISSTTLGVQEQ